MTEPADYTVRMEGSPPTLRTVLGMLTSQRCGVAAPIACLCFGHSPRFLPPCQDPLSQLHCTTQT